MNRITVEQVKGAYERTGFEPVSGSYYTYAEDQKTIIGACALGALCYDETGQQGYGLMAEDLFGLSGDYRVGFIRGFDGDSCPPECLYGEDGVVGHQDGVAARDAMVRTVPSSD